MNDEGCLKEQKKEFFNNNESSLESIKKLICSYLFLRMRILLGEYFRLLQDLFSLFSSVSRFRVYDWCGVQILAEVGWQNTSLAHQTNSLSKVTIWQFFHSKLKLLLFQDFNFFFTQIHSYLSRHDEALCSKILVVKSAAEEGLAALVHYIFSLVLDVRSCREDHHNLSLSSQCSKKLEAEKIPLGRSVPSMSNSRWAEALNSLSRRSPPFSLTRRCRCLHRRGETGMHVTHQKKVLRHSKWSKACM